MKFKTLCMIACFVIPTISQANSPIKLTSSEASIYERGEISSGEWIGGGLVGSFIMPFGVGQAIQGRYSDTGYIFTITELVSGGILVGGISSLSSEVTAVGLIALLGIRIWEIVDLWAGPASHNRKLKKIQTKFANARKNKTFASVEFVPVFSREQKPGLGISLRF